MSKRSDGVDAIREMAKAKAAAVANGFAVSAEVEDDFDHERLKVRVFMGEQSAVFHVNNIDVDYVLSDTPVRRKVERIIQDAVAELASLTEG